MVNETTDTPRNRPLGDTPWSRGLTCPEGKGARAAYGSGVFTHFD
nr:MAG TPA: hypothetical protein [Caudoviricetes sp.]